jgi:hypothetical protein
MGRSGMVWCFWSCPAVARYVAETAVKQTMGVFR